MGVAQLLLPPDVVGAMTLIEFDAVLAAHRQQKRQDAELNRNVIANAIYNVNRPRHKPFLALFEEEQDEKTVAEMHTERDEIFGTDTAKKGVRHGHTC